MVALEKMSGVIFGKQQLVEWSVASLPMRGQTVCGDRHLVRPFEGGILLAVVDGVGHGAEAAAAAHAAVEILEKFARESPISLVKRCHEALAQTRGVVMTVAVLRASENVMTWLGVGNVEGRLLRADASASHPRESVLLRGGLVGYQLPALQASVIPVSPGDLLVFATDGIRAGFDLDISLQETPEQIAGKILHEHFKENDDALVLAARYL